MSRHDVYMCFDFLMYLTSFLGLFIKHFVALITEAITVWIGSTAFAANTPCLKHSRPLRLMNSLTVHGEVPVVEVSLTHVYIPCRHVASLRPAKVLTKHHLAPVQLGKLTGSRMAEDVWVDMNPIIHASSLCGLPYNTLYPLSFKYSRPSKWS